MTLHEALCQIRDHGPAYHQCGISTNISFFAKEHSDQLHKLIGRWPEAADDEYYPVEGCSALHEELSYHGLLWDPESNMGAKRLRLLAWLIEQTAPRARRWWEFWK